MNARTLPFTLANRTVTRERLITALIFALLAHGILLLGVGFVALVPKPVQRPNVAVTLVRNTQVIPPPRKIDYLAQVNQRGPGNTARHPAPKPALDAGLPFLRPEANIAPAVRAASPALARLFENSRRRATQPRADVIKSTTGTRVIASDISHRQPLLTRLVSENDSRQANSQAPAVTLPRLHGSRPKPTAETTDTRASVFAAYLTAWRERIELVGNKHYAALVPAQIARGHVTLTISLDANGSIHSVRVVRHPRYPALEAAALKIIRLAAPYPPFPPAVRRLTDRLTFTYRWNFIRGGSSAGSVNVGTQP